MQLVRHFLGRNVIGKSRGSPKMFSTFDETRNLKKKGYEAEVAKEYREVKKRIQKAVTKAKGTGYVLSARRRFKLA